MVCLITGATSGMGRAVAELFAKEGANIILNGRDKQKGDEVLQHVRRMKAEAYFYHGDIASEELNRMLVEKALEHFGHLDVVFANAGMLGLGSVTEVEKITWHETIDVNLHSVFYLCRYAIPAMQRTGGGAIVVNSSIAANKSFPNHAAYCASKAAVTALAKQMALDYGPAIRINVISPGPVDTPFIWDSAVAFAEPDKAVQEALDKTVMKRLGMPEDIASLVLFLVTERSSWMTGSVVTIDGGVTIH